MRRYRRLYLGRREEGEHELGRYKKYWNKYEGFDSGLIEEFCSYDWERVTGVSLLRGEIVAVKINVEVVK